VFTGIITDLGRVRSVERQGERRIGIATSYDTETIALGASVACAGACLTVVDKDRGWFAADVSAETLARTTIASWAEGTPVNLERSLRVGDELGGHWVSGHVDGLARLAAREADGESLRLTFAAAPELARFITAKGSIALDGVSLTVNEVDGVRFQVNIIPYTQTQTSLGGLRPDDAANLEVDLVARYLARLTEDLRA
jgi:riboflavin synthase